MTLPRSAEDEARLAMLRDQLLMLRSKRVRPGLDDKVLADWNGLMIAALANAGTMLDEPAWIEMAARAFDVHCAQHDQGRPARAIPGARAGCSIRGSPPTSPT